MDKREIRQMMELLQIEDVTTKRQLKNGTITWKLPIKIGSGNRNIEVGSFKSGYVRNQNSCYSNYQLNPQYKAKTRTMFLSNKGLHTVEYEGIMRTKIWNQLARLKFMLDFYLRNYNVNTNTNG